MLNQKQKVCKGCAWIQLCYLPSHKKDKTFKTVECPCLTCLVKGVCGQWTACDKWIKYVELNKTGW